MKMTRRNFHSTLLLAAGAGVCSVAPAAFAANAAGAARPSYRHRLRFHRQGGVYSFWLRIVKPGNMSADVPFTLHFATDAAGKNVIHTNLHVARAASSHLVRGRIDMAAAGWTRGSPLFARFLLGEEQTPTKVLRLVPLHAD